MESQIQKIKKYHDKKIVTSNKGGSSARGHSAEEDIASALVKGALLLLRNKNKKFKAWR